MSRQTLLARGSVHSKPIERWVFKRLLSAIGRPRVRFQLWDGTAFKSPQEPSVGVIRILDRSTLWHLAWNPDIAFGDGYAAGRVEVEGNLVDVLAELYSSMRKARRGGLLSWRVKKRAPQRRHSTARSRENVEQHYNLGNDFYRLWLDERLVYTCAYYAEPGQSLEEAQLAKLDHVCRKLRLQPGQRVVEAGCGWGALALHMAERYGVQVRAYNLSRPQLELARERAAARGLERRVEFIEDDYRGATGECDAFVSVGMLEHVGPENYESLGRIMDRMLTHNGMGLIHTIGRLAPEGMDPWIEKRIFPGSYPPALSEMAALFEAFPLTVLDVENLRPHYERTCAEWLQRFEANVEQVRRMYDDSFVRTWRLYLAGSVAAFRTGELQLYQVVFSRQNNETVPWTRADLYPPK